MPLVYMKFFIHFLIICLKIFIVLIQNANIFYVGQAPIKDFTVSHRLRFSLDSLDEPLIIKKYKYDVMYYLYS